MAMVEQLNYQLLVDSKEKIGRSWCTFFKVIIGNGSKNPPPGCNLGSEFVLQSQNISNHQTAQ